MLALGQPLNAQTRFTFGGYVKLDVLNTKYHNGTPGPDSPLRDIHFPAAIPVEGESRVPFANIDYHAKESRFNLETRTRFSNGKVLRAFVEMDFLLSAQGDERISNSFAPRMRHFFFTYDKFLLGQTWTTFMILEPIVEDLDFGGTADGFIFGRQPQLRFTTGPWQFALENPETTLEPFGGGARRIEEAAVIPDLIARYNLAGEWGTIGVAGMLRQLKNEYRSADGDTVDAKYTMGYGVTAGGRIKVGRRDDLRFEASGGSGLGRYAGFGLSNAAVINAEREPEAIPSMLGFVGYRHFWTDRLRSNVNVSGIYIDNSTDLTGDEVNRAAFSFSLNLIYSPMPELDFGVELMRGVRELENGAKGKFDRVQFSGIYRFGFSTCTAQEGCP
ncbi:MAG: hypothetical protein AMS21_06775 [Gemmatimonas sp. SG8_38_2]|nr:MAG: hypothetical protein AMS21_06775 [Gemmatimonas sp. SG8_38_2]